MSQIKDDLSKMSIKDAIAYTTSILAFTIGFGIIILGFFVNPVGEIHDSNLWVLGESLSYTGAILGIGLYTKHSIEKMKRQLHIKDEEKEEEE